MKMNRFLLFLCVSLFLLSGCQEKKQQPIDEDKEFVAAINVQDFTIDFLNIKGEKIAHWTLNKRYTGGILLPDGDTLVLYGPELEQVDLYSLKQGKTTKQIHTGKGITNSLYIGGRSEFAFSDKELNKVRFFNKGGRETHAVPTADYPLAMETDGKRLFAASFKGEKLTIINLNNYKKEEEIPISASSTGMLLRKKEKELWLGGHGKGNKPQSSISIYSLDEHALKGELPAPLMPVSFLENEHGIYALSHGTNRLYRFGSDKKLIDEAEVGANPFDIEWFAGKLIVAGFDSNNLYWVDPETLTIERKVSVGKGPFVLFSREKVEK